jgi:hypothetical protein
MLLQLFGCRGDLLCNCSYRVGVGRVPIFGITSSSTHLLRERNYKGCNVILRHLGMIVFICGSIKSARPMPNGLLPRDAERNQQTSSQRDRHAVVFASVIPTAPSEMTLFKLAPQTPPTQLIQRSLSLDRHPVELIPLKDTKLFRDNHIEDSEQLRGVEQDQHIWAWFDIGTGDAGIYPSLRHLKPIRPETIAVLSQHAQQILQSDDLIKHDTTQSRLDAALLLKGGMISRREGGQSHWIRSPASYLAYFLVRRYIGPYPVVGPGSRAFIAFDEQNSVSGLLKVWKSATPLDIKVHPSFTTDQIVQKISSQLQPLATTGNVIVERVEIVYYDGNREFLQPVYRLTARIEQSRLSLEPSIADISVVGYVPYADGIEILHLVGSASDKRPSGTSCMKDKRPVSDGGAVGPMSVGRYVIRDPEDETGTDHSWIYNASDFMDSLSSSVLGKQFNNTQYCWAKPPLFMADKNNFINAMHIGLVEAHGTWWYFQTRQCSPSSSCDGVRLARDIAAPGYGAAAKGALALWVIHSCEVIPSPDDTAAWANVWWSIFGGIRSVVGYRTPILVYDGAESGYASSLGKLAPVVSSWLGEVIALNEYADHQASPGHDGKDHPMGRPATISVCGHEQDSVVPHPGLKSATCLAVWWFPDSL